MTLTSTDIDVLELPYGADPDPDDLIRAAMRWHFDEETGSPFWLRRAATLGFDPISRVKSFDDLALFPNVTDEIRDVQVRDLIPRGFGSHPDIVSVIESGGTTGKPKRFPLLGHFAELLSAQRVATLRAEGQTPDKGWLAIFPSGPHGSLEQIRRPARVFGATVFGVDFDPRWVKKVIAAGKPDEARAYVDHLVEQAGWVLRDENVGTLWITPPFLARLTQEDDLVELISEKVDHIYWGGAHMDADSRAYYRNELFPNTEIRGWYGTTVALGAGASERRGLGSSDQGVMDPYLSPYVTLSVVDPDTRQKVAIGEVGQVVVNHVSKSFFLPNNAERDLATRLEGPAGQVGDSVADIHPLQKFGGAEIIEGVY